MAIDPAALNALTAQWARAKADLDESENRSRINYNNALESLRRQNMTNVSNVATSMADRGLTQSGINAQQQIKVQDEFNRANALKAQQQELALSSIARRRLEADQEYNAQKALLESQAYQQMLAGGR